MKLVLDDEETIENPSAEQIRIAVEKIESGIHEFIRLERGGFLFIQAAKTATECIVVERRDGKESEILVTDPPVAVDKAIAILQSYLAGGSEMQTCANWVALSTLSPSSRAHDEVDNRPGDADGKRLLKNFSPCLLVGFGISISAALVSAIILQVQIQHRLSVKAFLLLCSTFVLAGCCRAIAKGQIRGRFYMLRKHESPVMFFLMAGLWGAFGVALALLTSFVP